MIRRFSERLGLLCALSLLVFATALSAVGSSEEQSHRKRRHDTVAVFEVLETHADRELPGTNDDGVPLESTAGG